MEIHDDDWAWFQKASAERGKRFWSVSDLARRMSADGRGPVDPIQLRRWLRGLHAPRHDVPSRVGRAFGWPPGYIDNPDMAYPPPKDNRAWLEMTLRHLDTNGRRVLASLSDPAAAEYLARALQQYEALRTQIEALRHYPPPPSTNGDE